MRKGISLSGWQPGDPTPDEIAAITAAIRRNWSMAEHDRPTGKRVPARFASSADETMGRVQSVDVASCVGDDVAEPAA